MLRACGALAAATAATLLSSQVQRAGPERAVYNHECEVGGRPCLEPRLAGGFPLQYWFDTPGVSVQHQLSLGEDVVRPLPLAGNVLFYLLVFVEAGGARRRCSRRRRFS